MPVEIGPITFSMKFQVMEIPSAYNFLLGRPWIHVTGGVPSSLHQKIKFIIKGKIVTIHANNGPTKQRNELSQQSWIVAFKPSLCQMALLSICATSSLKNS